MKRPPLLPVSLFILSICQMATPALAGGFAASRFGGEHGHPATHHPTAMYFNPAGLALSSGTHLYLEGLFVYRSASYDRSADAIDTVVPDGETASGTPEIATGANAGHAELGNYLASPFFGLVSDLGVPNLGVGVGVYAPFGGSAKWDPNLDYVGDERYPGAVDGVQRWSNIEGSQRAVYFTAAGAYRIPAANLSIGAGINYIRSEVSTVRARTATGTDDLMAGTDTLIEGRSLLEVEGTALSLSGGLAWQPVDNLVVGASYQSQPGFGEHGLEGTLTNKFGAGTVTESPVELRQSLPDVARLGAALRPRPGTELRLSGDWTRWSVFDKQCVLDLTDPNRNCALTEDGGVDAEAGGSGIVVNVQRSFKDTFGVRLGGSYWFQPNFEVYGGAAYDSNAVPDETIDAALIDMDKVIGSLGVRYGMMRGRLALSASLTYVAYFARTVDARDRDDDGDPVTMDAPSRNPDGAGTYDQDIGLLTVGAQYAF